MMIRTTRLSAILVSAAVVAAVLAGCTPATDTKPTPTPRPSSASPTPQATTPQADPTAKFNTVGQAADGGTFQPLVLPERIPYGKLDTPFDSQWLRIGNPNMGDDITITLGNKSSTVTPTVMTAVDSITENLPAGAERDMVVGWTGATPGSPAAAPDQYVVQRVTMRVRQIAQNGQGDISTFNIFQSMRFLNLAGEDLLSYPGDGQYGCSADATPFAKHGYATNDTVQLCFYVAASPATFNRSAWVGSIIIQGSPALGQNALVVTDKRPAKDMGE